jgi:hypothetical protein
MDHAHTAKRQEVGRPIAAALPYRCLKRTLS